MRIPDCRTDEVYNYYTLDDVNKYFIDGYDYCTEHVVDNFFHNLDIYFNDDSILIDIFNKDMPESMHTQESITFGEYLKECLLDYIEISRDEIIVSIIDNEGVNDDD